MRIVSKLSNVGTALTLTYTFIVQYFYCVYCESVRELQASTQVQTPSSTPRTGVGDTRGAQSQSEWSSALLSAAAARGAACASCAYCR